MFSVAIKLMCIHAFLTNQQVIAKDIRETQTARATDLLRSATDAEDSGSFAGKHMVQVARELETLVKVNLPTLAQGRLDAINVMISWRRTERNIRSESAWLKEQLTNPILNVQNEEVGI